MTKTRQIFYCEYCDYSSCKESDYNKHLLTTKHKKNYNNDVLSPKYFKK